MSCRSRFSFVLPSGPGVVVQSTSLHCMEKAKGGVMRLAVAQGEVGVF